MRKGRKMYEEERNEIDKYEEEERKLKWRKKEGKLSGEERKKI